MRNETPKSSCLPLKHSQAAVAEVQKLRSRAEKEVGRWPSLAEAPETSRRAISLLQPSSSEDEAEAAFHALRAMCCSLLAAPTSDAAESRAREEAVGQIFEETFGSERVLMVRWLPGLLAFSGTALRG